MLRKRVGEGRQGQRKQRSDPHRFVTLTQSENERRHGNDKGEGGGNTGTIVSATAAAVIALMTVVTAGVSYFQWQQLRTTDATVREALIATGRAWLYVDLVQLAAPLKIGYPLVLQVSYGNAGNGPASGVHPKSIPKFVPRPPAGIGFQAFDFGRNETCDGLRPAAGGGVLHTGNPRLLNVSSVPVTAALMKGETVYVLHGCFAYMTLGTERHTAFCYYLDPGIDQSATAGTFLGCHTGNHAN